MIPDFMLPGALFSWGAVAAWFAVGWTGLMTYSCMGAFWWRAMVSKHCERCLCCQWKVHSNKFDMYYDHEVQFFFGAALWPISSVLLFLRLLIWKPIKAAVIGIITPAPPAPEPEPEVPTGMRIAKQGHHIPDRYDPYEIIDEDGRISTVVTLQ